MSSIMAKINLSPTLSFCGVVVVLDLPNTCFCRVLELLDLPNTCFCFLWGMSMRIISQTLMFFALVKVYLTQ